MINSFYGGRPTIPFVIAKNYNNIDAMITDFKTGDSCTVKYGQYVLIDDSNKNELYTTATSEIVDLFGEDSKVFTETMNGQLFRRSTEYDNAIGGAIYIGNIAGPSGKGMNIVLELIYGDTYGSNKDSAIKYLNTKYPDGYGADKSVFVLYKYSLASTNGDLYCYGDASNSWIFVGQLSSADCFTDVVKAEEEDFPGDLDTIGDSSDNASWFVVESLSAWKEE